MTKEKIRNWSNENGLAYRSDLHDMYESLYRAAFEDGKDAERNRLADELQKMPLNDTANSIAIWIRGQE